MSNVATQVPALDAVADRALHAQLDRPPSVSITDAIRAAATETGSGTSWLPGFWRACSGPGDLLPAEYFYYSLYKFAQEPETVERYVGKSAQEKMHRACCDPEWFSVARDKIEFLRFMTDAGISVPDTKAIYDPTGRVTEGTVLRSAREIEDYLDDPDHYPLFAKPIDGMYSVGALSLTDGGEGRAHVQGAGIVGTTEISHYMAELGTNGYLLQRTLRAAPSLIEAFGGALSTVRFLVLLGDDGPAIESAVVKIPRQDAAADNYWRSGNMLGALHTETGKITRVVTGMSKNLRQVSEHPDTMTVLPGFQLPYWKEAVSLCQRAARAASGLRTQSWDIAITHDGPVAIEVNWGGDLNLHQLAHGRGALTPTFVDHLRANGYGGKLPAA